MDILTDVLQMTHLRNVCHGPVVLAAPWGLRRSASPGRYSYLLPIEGHCVLEVDGYGVYHLRKGDVAFLMLDRGHTLRDCEASEALSRDEFMRTRKEDDGGFERYGGDGARTIMVWGGFEFEEGNRNPLLASLPPVIHVHSSGKDGNWQESCVSYLTEELTAKPPGHQMIANRLIDILFVQAVRSMYVAGESESRRGWGCALVEPQISRALAAIHTDPRRDWTVDSLAREAGMSRSGFAARFTECVGTAPGAYLTSWRMQKAAEALRSTTATLDEIADQAGYASEAAFVRAFKRIYGATPQSYRRAERNASAAMTHA